MGFLVIIIKKSIVTENDNYIFINNINYKKDNKNIVYSFNNILILIEDILKYNFKELYSPDVIDNSFLYYEKLLSNDKNIKYEDDSFEKDVEEDEIPF